MSLLNYPPQIEKKLSAFAFDEGDAVKINVPYRLNKALSLNSFNKMVMLVKTTTTSMTKWTGVTNECKMYSNIFNSYYASFTIPKSEFLPTVGNYYKIQLAFSSDTQQSVWSSTGIIKCIQIPTLRIESLTSEIDNISPDVFIGVYENRDATEKVYSYKFTIYDNNNNIFDESDELIHNGTTDEIISGVGVKATLTWKPKKEMAQYIRYRIILSIKTINGHIKSTSPYVIKAVSTIDADIPARLLVTPDYDNGCIHLSLIKLNRLVQEEAFSGSFLISRYQENLDQWDEICRFNMLSQKPSDMGIIWTDYTVEHGVNYLYAIQAYNSKHLYSNKMYHVMANPDPMDPRIYLEYDKFGKPLKIMGDFEDMFLTDGKRQLKIKFNPQVSSYKPTILENKVDTIGSKYPFMFRNGNVNYKEFSLSGLLSYLEDEKELFMTGIRPPEDLLSRSNTPAAANLKQEEALRDVPEAGSKLTSENFYREREFKTEALSWLTNGKPKLFRSAGEGNFIVRLTSVSLSPNNTVGRMLHTFNATAYEIDEITLENLKKYELVYLPESNSKVMKFVEVNLGENSENDIYSPGYSMYHVSITNAPPYTRYSLRFNELSEHSAVSYDIGFTGSLFLDSDAYPVTSIKKEFGDENNQAILRYGYYDTVVPDDFDNISEIKYKDEIAQIIGYNFTVDIISEYFKNDKRKQLGHFYTVSIKPKNIEEIEVVSGGKYRNKKTKEILTKFVETTIYKINDTSYLYYTPNGIHNTSTAPSMRFKLNNTYEIDLSNQNHQTVNNFIQYTQGSYNINCGFGEIKSLYLSPGVYAEVSYELKEIKYTIEDINPTIKNLYNDWQKAIENYLNVEKDETKTSTQRDNAYQNIKVKYINYITYLKELLEEE